MKKAAVLFGTIVVFTLTSCETIKIISPEESSVRSEGNISFAEYSQVAQEAVKNALSSRNLGRFLKKYSKENGDDAVPVIQVADIINDTTKHINTPLLTDEISTALINSGLMEVTMATGAEVRSSFADARDLKYDKNFRKTTVAKEGTLEAPSLSLEGRIVENIVRGGSVSETTRSFNLKIADIITGKVIWAYNKTIGFQKD